MKKADNYGNINNKETLENPNLTYLGFYDMRTAGDIKPGVKLFEETYGGKIDYYQVAWGERIDKLQMLISSGDSPDLVDKEDIANFKVVVNAYSGFSSDLTPVIDTMLLNIAFETDASGSWAQLVSENEGIINTVLDNFGKE